jgi:GTP-binding protein YchF
VGKTTLYNALTAAQAETGGGSFAGKEPNVSIFDVPDAHLGRIAEFIPTKKIIPATVTMVDIAGVREGSAAGDGVGARFLAHIREVDAIVQVVQCFESPNTVRTTPVDARRDIEVLEMELALADLETVTRARDRSSKKARSGDKVAIHERDVCDRAKEQLERGVQLRTLEWKRAELDVIRPLCFLTMKPVLYVANVGDADLVGDGPQARAVSELALSTGSRSLALGADLECELRRMSEEDREVFMAEYGMTELALPRLLHEAYVLLGMQTFYTAGEKEVRAWTIREGDSAPVAAGKIHSDFEKGFIRLEAYSVTDLFELGSEGAIRAAGKLRTEGRDYVMRPDDVCHFLVGR